MHQSHEELAQSIIFFAAQFLIALSNFLVHTVCCIIIVGYSAYTFFAKNVAAFMSTVSFQFHYLRNYNLGSANSSQEHANGRFGRGCHRFSLPYSGWKIPGKSF
jgi:hypothetical protein